LVHHHSSVSSRPSVQPSPQIGTSSSRRQSSVTWTSCSMLSCQCASMSVTDVLLSSAPHTLSPSSTRPRRHCQAITALMLSHIDHCNAVLASLPAMTLAPLQRILHAAARRPTVLDYVTPALRELHWLPITERKQYKLRACAQDVPRSHAPDYIAIVLTLASDIPSRSSLRSSSNCDLVI